MIDARNLPTPAGTRGSRRWGTEVPSTSRLPPETHLCGRTRDLPATSRPVGRRSGRPEDPSGPELLPFGRAWIGVVHYATPGFGDVLVMTAMNVQPPGELG